MPFAHTTPCGIRRHPRTPCRTRRHDRPMPRPTIARSARRRRQPAVVIQYMLAPASEVRKAGRGGVCACGGGRLPPCRFVRRARREVRYAPASALPSAPAGRYMRGAHAFLYFCALTVPRYAVSARYLAAATAMRHALCAIARFFRAMAAGAEPRYAACHYCWTARFAPARQQLYAAGSVPVIRVLLSRKSPGSRLPFAAGESAARRAGLPAADEGVWGWGVVVCGVWWCVCRCGVVVWWCAVVCGSFLC